MSRVLARRRENWRGVRSGALSGAEGKRVMWRGLLFLPITPRQAIEGMAVIISLYVVRLSGSNRSRELVEVR